MSPMQKKFSPTLKHTPIDNKENGSPMMTQRERISEFKIETAPVQAAAPTMSTFGHLNMKYSAFGAGGLNTFRGNSF